jgi:hypothetical protein
MVPTPQPPLHPVKAASAKLAFTVMITAFDVIVTQLAYNFVMLPIIGKAVNLPISVVLVGVLVGFAMGTILFAFLVVPLIATALILVRYVLAKIGCASLSRTCRCVPHSRAAISDRITCLHGM